MKCRNVERIDIDTNNKKAENDKDSLSEVFYNAKNCEYEELASHDSSSTSTFISASSRPYSPPCASSLAITQDNSFNFDDGDGDGRDCQRCNKAIHCGEKSNLPALLFPEASESQTSECDFQKDSSCRVENITISPTSHITLLDLAGSQNLTDKGLLQLSNLSSLEIAKLDNCHSIQGRGTAIFANSHRLHTLSMSHCRRLSDEAIASISHLSSLEALSLAGCRCLTDRSLFAIGNMESLTKLDLSQCDLITDYGLAELESCRNIEELLLGWCRSLTDDGIDLLVNHPERHNTLRVLSLARVPITDAGIKSIGLLLSLEELDLNGCSNISSSALGNSLSKMTKLERLDVSYCPGILRSSWQGKINSLKILDACYSAVRDSHITRLTYLPNLEELNLDSCPVGGDSAISHLETCCPNLTSLDLADTELSDLGMVHISKFSALQRLSLFYCNITNSALRHLSALTNLEVLNLDSREIGDSGLWHLRNLKNLKSLDIFSGRVTDSGCEHIAKIESLESLELCGGGITDLGCSHIAGGLENLTSLNLSQNERITNRGAAALASLTKLKTLNLSNTQVDSEALIHFSDLRSLKSLALYGCQMGTINEMQLLNGLPNLKCIRLNASSDDEFNGMISAQSVESDIGNMDSEADLVTFGSHRHSRSDQEDNETSDSSLSSSDETDGNV